MKKNGFTLVEILAVISVLAILAVITYPVIDDILSDSNEKTFKTSVEELLNVAEVDYTENGRYGTVTYTLNSNNTFACSGCDNLEYQGEIKNGAGTITLVDGKATDVDIANDIHTATLVDGKVKVTEK